MVPHYDAAIAYRWVVTWIIVCGFPIAISMGMPPWVKMDDDDKPKH